MQASHTEQTVVDEMSLKTREKTLSAKGIEDSQGLGEFTSLHDHPLVFSNDNQMVDHHFTCNQIRVSAQAVGWELNSSFSHRLSNGLKFSF